MRRIIYNTYPQLTPMYASGYADFIISSLVTDTDITIEAEEEVTAEQEDILTELAQQCAAEQADSCTVRRTGCDRWWHVQHQIAHTHLCLMESTIVLRVVTMTKVIQFSMTQAAGYSDTYYVWNAPYTYIYMT